MAASQPLPTATGQGGLYGFVQSLVNAGAANGWTQFGGSNAAKGVPAAGVEQGSDIGLAPGTAVPGVNGKVMSVSPIPGSAGDFAVTMKDTAGNLVRVLHLGRVNVAPGQSITSSTIIGLSGGLPSSVSTGPHIEFQVMPAGAGSVVNPLAWLQQQGQSPAAAFAQAAGQAQTQGSPSGLAQAVMASPTNLDFTGSIGHVALQIGLFLLALTLIVLGVVVLLRKPIATAGKAALV